MKINCFGRTVVTGLLLLGPIGAAALAGLAAASQGEQDLTARARAIHERVITLDTHNDIETSNFTRACNYTMNLTTQVNLPKMKAGGLDVSFMIVYVGQSNPPQVADAFQPSGYDRAYKAAVAKFDAIHHLTKEIAPNEIELALTAADVTRIAKSGKKVAVIGIENGYPLGTDIKRVKEFWDRGGRYMSLAHNGHSQLSDSNTGEANNQWSWGGLSLLGRQVIEEMNRWGIMVDVSHPSKGSMMQTIGLSKAPVIASHSGVRKFANVSRNMDNEMLMAMKTNGGVIQMVALSGYVKSDPPERSPAVNALRRSSAWAAVAVGRVVVPVEAVMQVRPPRPRVRWKVRHPLPRAGVAAAVPRRASRRSRPIGAPSSGAAWRKSIASGPWSGARRSGTSSTRSTMPSSWSASITSASRPTSTAAAASTAGTAPRKRSTSRWSSFVAATPKSRSARFGAAISCACGARWSGSPKISRRGAGEMADC